MLIYTLQDVETAINYAITRVFLINAKDLTFIINFFPDKHSFLMGKALIMDVMAALPGPDTSFNGWMYSLIYPMSEAQGGINASVGELWAEFGPLYIFPVFMWGFLIELIFVFFWRSFKKHPSDVVAYSFLLFGLSNTAAGIVPKIIEFIVPTLFAYFGIWLIRLWVVSYQQSMRVLEKEVLPNTYNT